MLLKAFLSVLGRIRENFVRVGDDDRGIGVVEVILILVEILTYRYMYI